MYLNVPHKIVFNQRHDAICIIYLFYFISYNLYIYVMFEVFVLDAFVSACFLVFPIYT